MKIANNNKNFKVETSLPFDDINSKNCEENLLKITAYSKKMISCKVYQQGRFGTPYTNASWEDTI